MWEPGQGICRVEVLVDWRMPTVVLLFKKDCKGKPGNYRPVSLPSVVDKLLEGFLRDKICIYLERWGFIRYSQHGFCGWEIMS